jgi:Uma2 family endonuclease
MLAYKGTFVCAREKFEEFFLNLAAALLSPKLESETLAKTYECTSDAGSAAVRHVLICSDLRVAVRRERLMHEKHPPDTLLDEGEPAWGVATLFPNQGDWSVDDYLALDTRRLVEFTDGHTEILPRPTEAHQLILIFLFDALRAFVGARRLGLSLLSPFRVRLSERKFREPDLVFMFARHAKRRRNQFWEGADLVMEVVSEEDRERDVVRKRRDYALARIPEYWIVDPRRKQITVLQLTGDRYAVHGVFKPRQKATSPLLPGFSVSVSAVFKAAEVAGE